MERKYVLLIAVVVVLAIAGFGINTYYANMKDTRISDYTYGNSAETVYHPVIYTQVFIHPQSSDMSLNGERLNVTVIDSKGEVVKVYELSSGEQRKVKDLKPGKYKVLYNYTGHYPYKSSSSSADVEVLTESKFNELQKQLGEDKEYRRELYSVLYG